MFGERPTFYRKTLGVLAIAVAVVAATALWLQIADLVQHDAFVWQEYFSYFTIMTTILNIVALLFGGFASLSSERDTVFRTIVRQSLVTYALISAGVYHLLLRELVDTTNAYVSGDSLPMHVFHTYVPAYLLIDWLINPYRARTPWVSLFAVIPFPVLWLGITLYRGEQTGWYPYRFLNPLSEVGWPGVIQNIAFVSVAIIVIQLVLLATNRVLHRTSTRKTSRV